MKKVLVVVIIFLSSAFCKDGVFTLKSYLTGPLTWSTSSVATIALEVQPFNRSSFEIAFGFAYEAKHTGKYANYNVEYQDNGEWAIGFTYLFNLVQTEKTSFKVYSQIKYVKASIMDNYFYSKNNQSYMVYATIWKNYNIFNIGVEPTLHISKHITAFTRFGLTAYKSLPNYYVDDDAEDFPNTIKWKVEEKSAFRIGTTIDTWVIGIGYTF